MIIAAIIADIYFLFFATLILPPSPCLFTFLADAAFAAITLMLPLPLPVRGMLMPITPHAAFRHADAFDVDAAIAIRQLFSMLRCHACHAYMLIH